MKIPQVAESARHWQAVLHIWTVSTGQPNSNEIRASGPCAYSQEMDKPLKFHTVQFGKQLKYNYYVLCINWYKFKFVIKFKACCMAWAWHE